MATCALAIRRRSRAFFMEESEPAMLGAPGASLVSSAVVCMEAYRSHAQKMQSDNLYSSSLQITVYAARKCEWRALIHIHAASLGTRSRG